MVIPICFLLFIGFNFISGEKNVLPEKPVCGQQIIKSDNDLRRTAKEGEFPWVALLKYEGDNPYKCVGSLISDRYVLTSSVCVKSKRHNVVGVRLGEHTLGNDTHSEEFCIEKIIPHDGFKQGKKQFNNDIALLKLCSLVKFSDYIKPICLSKDSLSKPEDNIFISGWGKNAAGHTVNTKKIVTRRVISNPECQLDFLSHNITITDEYICTHTLKDHKDFSCAGDGGAPLMVNSEGTWYQEGIVSFGSPCGHDFPDGNTRVSKYFSWINDMISQN